MSAGKRLSKVGELLAGKCAGGEGFDVDCVAGRWERVLGQRGGGVVGGWWWYSRSGALAGDKHGLISDSCRNQNIVSSCILMS